MKQTIIVTVFDKEQYEGEWPPTDAAGALAWFSSKVNDVPEKFRGSAKIEIEGTTSYDCAYARIQITYERPEIDAEESAREGRAEMAKQQQVQRELQILSALQAKYGAQSTPAVGKEG